MIFSKGSRGYWLFFEEKSFLAIFKNSQNLIALNKRGDKVGGDKSNRRRGEGRENDPNQLLDEKIKLNNFVPFVEFKGTATAERADEQGKGTRSVTWICFRLNI